MRRYGVLEGLARAELGELVESVGTFYRPGSVERLALRDPAWREALDRAETEVGTLYEAMQQADLTLARWRRAMAELTTLWMRVRGAPAEADGEELRVSEPRLLDEVA